MQIEIRREPSKPYISPARQQAITEALKQHPRAFAAQGGGLVVWAGKRHGGYVFVLPPDWGYKAGDPMPEEWGIGSSVMAS